MKDISKHYDILTPQERLVMTVEAMARGDMEEKNRLATSCPKKSYRINDDNYSMAYFRLLDLAMLYLLSAYRSLARANRAECAFIAGRDEALAVLKCHKVEQFTIQEAWKQFCIIIGMDGSQVFAAFGLDVTDLQRTPLDDGIVSDDEAVAGLVADLLKLWDSPM